MNEPASLSLPVLDPDLLRHIIEAQGALAAAKFDLDVFMQDVVMRMQALTDATGAVVELLEKDEMVYRAASGSVAPFNGLRLKAKGSLSGMCVETKEIMISEDTANDPRVNADACKKVGATSMVVVPLFSHEEAVGVLKVVSTKVNAFTERDLQILKLMAGLLGGTLGQQLEAQKREAAAEELKHQAQYDSLTGLPNRALFRDRLDHAIRHTARRKTPLALMFLDIDHFKPVNDTHGHDAGDLLLKLFAARIKALVRETDTFARLGGDEFTLILEGVRGKEDVTRIAAAIVEAAHHKFDLGHVKVKVSTSIGIAVMQGEKQDLDELIKHADTALYETKKNGRNGFTFFKA